MRKPAVLFALCLTAALAQTVVFSDNMENFPTGWTLNRASGSDLWARMNTRKHSGTYSAKCTNRAAYVRTQNTWLQRYVNLSSFSAARLSFWVWCYTEQGYDYASLQLHSPAGWTEVWRDWGARQYWDSIDLDVPVTTDSVRFRFFAYNDEIVFEGVYLDDVVLTGYRPDVSLTAITAPTDTVDTADMILPSCTVTNLTPLNLSYYVRCRIGPGYFKQTYVFNHTGFSTRVVDFEPWYIAPRGPLAVRCSTRLATDVNPANDWREDTVFVRVRNVACRRVTAPLTDLDSGFAVTPQALVANTGTSAETFQTIARLGGFYDNSEEVTLAAGDNALVTFGTAIVTGPRGPTALRCTTFLAADRNPNDDTASRALLINVHDVGVTALASPGPEVDSGTVVSPKARLRNDGTRTEDFACVFSIGTAYTDTQPVARLAPLEELEVSFSDWLARPGSYQMACRTLLAGDLVKQNDTACGPLLVRYLDASVNRILAPHTRVVPGVIVPRVEVANSGNLPITDCAVTLSINPGGYTDTRQFSLEPGLLDTVDFASWSATAGSYVAAVRHALPGDMNRANDSIGKLVEVGAVYHDLGTSAIARPTEQENPGDIRPEALVMNYGSVPETNVKVVLWVDNTDAVFADTQTVATINPGDELNVRFRTWLAYTGSFSVRSWTCLAGDAAPSNDTARVNVTVALHNVSPKAVTCPTGTIGAGFPISPAVKVRNRGTAADSFAVFMLIEHETTPVYFDSARGAVAPHETVEVSLPDWLPAGTGAHQLTAWTWMPDDIDQTDDTIWEAFDVAAARMDAAAQAVVAPDDSVYQGLLAPVASVMNPGNVLASFWTGLWITDASGTVYSESAWVDALRPLTTQVETLPAWDARAGRYFSRLWVRCQGDANPGNDTARRITDVLILRRWQEKHSLPLLPGGKPTKDGAWLAAGPAALYCAKGNKTPDFYRYDLVADTWYGLESIPAGEQGRSKLPGKGAAAASSDDGCIYMVKGNNTLGFWRYDAGPDSWTRQSDIPSGPESKSVKGGGDLAYACRADTGWLYFLKGYRTEFYRFNAVAGRWDSLANAPSGPKGRYDKGSFLVHDGADRLYCHQAKYNDGVSHFMFCYDLAADSWERNALQGMPLAGLHNGRISRKKSKDGGCGTWFEGTLYALKGGNSQQFWAYSPLSRVWTELETLPSFGSTQKRRRVKAGADIEALGSSLWALKGNRTREFWTFAEPGKALAAARRMSGSHSGALGLPVPTAFRVWPNPAEGRVNMSGILPGSPLVASVYDVTGRLRLRANLPASSHTVALDVTSLAPGCYVLRLTSSSAVVSARIIIR